MITQAVCVPEGGGTAMARPTISHPPRARLREAHGGGLHGGHLQEGASHPEVGLRIHLWGTWSARPEVAQRPGLEV